MSPERKTLEDKITRALVGVVAEVRFSAPAIHRYANGTYDFLVARLLIDQVNALGEWPPLTFEGAARKAVKFVSDHWQAIQNVALALSSTGELPDHEVRIFAGWPQ